VLCVCVGGGGGGGGGGGLDGGCFSGCNSFSHPTPNLIWILGNGSIADCIIFLNSLCVLSSIHAVFYVGNRCRIICTRCMM
jgi:hypothetical protein